MTTTSRAQQSFAFGDDDGSIAAHSLDTVDQDRTAQTTGTANKFLLRIVIEETNNKNDNVSAGLRYSYDGGAYVDITGASSVVRAIASSNWSDDAAITAGRLGYTGTWVNGRTDSDGADTTGVSLQNEYTEFLFCVYIVDADVANGKNIDFEVYDAGSAINAYNIIPRVTVSKPTVLVPQDGAHTHISESPALTQVYQLTVQDGAHNHFSDNAFYPLPATESGWRSILVPVARRSQTRLLRVFVDNTAEASFGDIVQNQENNAASDTSVTVTLTNTPKEGNLLIANHFTGDGNSTAPSGFSEALALTNTTDSDQGAIYYKVAGASESKVITAGSDNADEHALNVLEVEGEFAASPLDKTAIGDAGGAPSYTTTRSTTTTATTTQADEFAVALVVSRFDPANYTNWTNSFIQRAETGSGSAKSLGSATRLLTSTGTYETTVTGDSTKHMAGLATFKKKRDILVVQDGAHAHASENPALIYNPTSFEFVQTNYSSNQDTVTLTGVTAGNLIVVFTKHNTDLNPVTAVGDGTDSLVAGSAISNGSTAIRFWYLLATTSGDKTYTVTYPGSAGGKRTGVVEYSYDGVIVMDDEVATEDGGDDTTAISGNVTTTGDEHLLLASSCPNTAQLPSDELIYGISPWYTHYVTDYISIWDIYTLEADTMYAQNTWASTTGWNIVLMAFKTVVPTLVVQDGAHAHASDAIALHVPVKKYWNFADESSVPSEFSEIEGGSGAVAIVSDHLQIDTGGTGSGDYAAAVYDTPLAPDKLTVIYGECKFSGVAGAWTPNLVGLIDSSGTPAAMTAANRDAGLRMWQEYQISSSGDSSDRIQAKFKNPSGTQYQWIASTQTWQSAFAYTRAYFDEGSYYRFVIIYDGTTSPARARTLVYGFTEGSAAGWNINYDSTWVDFDTGASDIDPFDNDIYAIFGDPTNDETKSAQVTFDFRKIMIGEIDESNVDEFAFTNKGGYTFPYDYEIFAYLNPMPETQTLWVSRDYDGYYAGGDETDTPVIANGSNTWVKDPHVYFDGTTYWMFYQIRDSGDGDSDIFVSSTTDILNGTWGSATEISTTDTGEDKHEFPWVTKYGGTWYMFYGVELDSGPTWEIQYKTTTQTNPTSGWSSATTILTAGAAGKFDDAGVSNPVLIWYSGTFTGGTWYMFYGGNDGSARWRGGLAKSTTGITGTYTRVDVDPFFTVGSFSTLLDGTHTDAAAVTVDSTTNLSAGDLVYIVRGSVLHEVLSVDSGTQFTPTIEVTASDNNAVKSFTSDDVVPRFAKRINGYWVLYVTTFGLPNGSEFVSIYVATTTDLDLADCTFRQLRVGDAAIDFVIPAVVATFTGTGVGDDVANENIGTVWEELSRVTDATPLTVQDGAHTHISESPALTQDHSLSVQDGAHSHISENPVLIQSHILITQDGLHSHASDAIALTQAHALSVQDGSHSHASDAMSVFSFPWKDGFESGDTSRWHGSTGTPTINGTAALEGSYGMEQQYNVAAEHVYLTWDNTTHQVYRFKFRVDPNGIVGDTGDWLDLAILFVDGQWESGIELQKTAVGYEINLITRGTTSNSESITDEPHIVEAEWTFASGGAGVSKWWIDGVEKTGQTGWTSDIYPNKAVFGNWVDPSPNQFNSGSIYLDDFTVYNTARPLGAITPQDGAHAHASDAIALTQDHTLSVQDGAHTHISENPVLVQTVDLVPSDGSHTHISENPVLSQVHNLIPQDGLHAHDGEVPDLAQTAYLVSQDGLHTHVSESPALTQFNVLSTQDGLHSHTSDSPSLTQDHVLVTLDGLHAHTGELLNLSGTASLSVQDGAHTHISDAFALTQYHNLTSQDGLHTHTGEVPSLDVTHYLVSQDGAHTHISDGFAITQTHNLIPQDGAHAHIAEVPSLSVTHVIVTQDGSHTHISENVDLTRIEWFVPTNVMPRRSRQIPIRQLRL